MAAPASINPLEGRLLEHSHGNFYVYHDGVKFPVQPASTGDRVIDAIPECIGERAEQFLHGDRSPGTLGSQQSHRVPRLLTAIGQP